METKGKSSRATAKIPTFVKRAERAMQRVARNLRKQCLPVVIWQNGKVVEKSA